MLPRSRFVLVAESVESDGRFFFAGVRLGVAESDAGGEAQAETTATRDHSESMGTRNQRSQRLLEIPTSKPKMLRMVDNKLRPVLIQ